jgi:hypothetical protein
LKTRITIIMIFMAMTLIPQNSQAFNNERKGFILGLGGGYGSAKVSGDNDSDSWGGLATTFKIGGGTTDQVLLYYSNRVVFFSVNSYNFYQGMSAFGVSYFLEPQAPSFYFSGELGLGILGTWEEGGDSDSGFGFTFGAGYEVSPHFVLEANYMRASVSSDGGFDYTISNFTFAASWLGF